MDLRTRTEPPTRNLRSLLAPSAILLANLAPLVGVLALGWDLGEVVLLYWAETALLGGFAITKLLLVQPSRRHGAFFALHFGIFALVTCVFTVSLFVQQPSFTREADALVVRGEGPVLPTVLAILPGVVLVAASHGHAFVRGFVRGGERETIRADPEGSAKRLVLRAYVRILIMVGVIIATAELMARREAPLWGLVLLVALKLLVDLVLQAVERIRQGRAGSHAAHDATNDQDAAAR